MSGHSKWSTIKRKKGLIDEQRSKVFQKLAKEIYVAAKNGDKDVSMNPALRAVVEKAKAQNMPKDRIESAINKASSKGAGENYDVVRYEGYGPNGMAIMVDCLTDNKNRTASFVRTAFNRHGGNLSTSGSVSYLFTRYGVIVLDREYDEMKLMEDIMEFDIEDFKTNDDSYEIICMPDKFLSIKEALEAKKYDKFLSTEITFLPQNYVDIDEKSLEVVENLLDALDDIDDVQNVYHNMN